MSRWGLSRWCRWGHSTNDLTSPTSWWGWFGQMKLLQPMCPMGPISPFPLGLLWLMPTKAAMVSLNSVDRQLLIFSIISTACVLLISLTKYSAIVAKMKGYFGRTLYNNQRRSRRWSLCSLRMQDQVKFNNQLEVDNRCQSNNQRKCLESSWIKSCSFLEWLDNKLEG
jgi:hypothetical protein